MSSPTILDARGMLCPRPIIELAKLRRSANASNVIEITADDLAFESDLRAWCHTTGSRLLGVDREGHIVTATVQFSAPH